MEAGDTAAPEKAEDVSEAGVTITPAEAEGVSEAGAVAVPEPQVYTTLVAKVVPESLAEALPEVVIKTALNEAAAATEETGAALEPAPVAILVELNPGI